MEGKNRLKGVIENVRYLNESNRLFITCTGPIEIDVFIKQNEKGGIGRKLIYYGKRLFLTK